MKSLNEDDINTLAAKTAAENAEMARLVADKMLYPWRFWSPQSKRIVGCIILLSVLFVILLLLFKTDIV